jgi:hypothetical protein
MEDASPAKVAVSVSGEAAVPATPDFSEKDSDIRKKAELLGLPFLSDVPKGIDKSVLSFVPEDAARKYGMAVFAKEGETIRIAMVDPEDFEALNMLRFLAEKEQLNIDVHLASP